MKEPNLDNLNIDDENPKTNIRIKAISNAGFDPSLCLLGRFLTDRPMRSYIMKEKNVTHLEASIRCLNY